MPGLLEVVKVAAGGILKPVVDLVDNMHTSEEEKLLLKAQVLTAQQDFEARLYEAETTRLQVQLEVQKAEQATGTWLSKSWRPIVGLQFVGTMFLCFGLPAILGRPVTVELPQEYWYSNLGILGVAIAGRSAEKIAKAKVQGGSQ